MNFSQLSYTEMKVRLDELRENPWNFFRAADPEEVRELALSIREHGLLHPIVVRPVEGGYEIISGHRRKQALEYLGVKETTVRVVEVDDVEAELMLIDANLESRALSPMEVARAIRRKKELMGERRGRKERNNCANYSGKTSQLLASEFGLSPRQIENYDKLNDLIPELQLLVERGKLKPTTAVHIASWPPEAQRDLYEALGDEIAELKVKEVMKLKEESERGYFVLRILQRKLEEVEARLAEYTQAEELKENLKEEIARLRLQKKQLEYDIIDRQNALKALENRAVKKGAALIELLERLCRPVQAALPDIEHYLGEGLEDEAFRAYALRWAAVLRQAALLIEERLQSKMRRVK
ncbi:chromosome partitioning protein, ParB family [Thermanaeromonas toyohensis ToBE]|uniref:Chromosome partitioning protein, ParB family n=1 Tax=Thermanaeromonas toyohensis ToBE TaxID=698762 RepID=A0A1W1VV20_9FIRM|nr:ParB/RepB/Spo0J family partition protein [Thermanaeromonas toyohensis]SMB96724.1 chromosome partitioning protein, ParB family [Thermanaeromonas toyohensis ToBE]